MDHYKRTARWSGKCLQRRLIQILRGGLPFVHFCIDQQSVDAQTLLYQRTTKKKQCTVSSLKEICWKNHPKLPAQFPDFNWLTYFTFAMQITDMFTTNNTRSPSSGHFYQKYFRLNSDSQKLFDSVEVKIWNSIPKNWRKFSIKSCF